MCCIFHYRNSKVFLLQSRLRLSTFHLLFDPCQELCSLLSDELHVRFASFVVGGQSFPSLLDISHPFCLRKNLLCMSSTSQVYCLCQIRYHFLSLMLRLILLPTWSVMTSTFMCMSFILLYF